VHGNVDNEHELHESEMVIGTSKMVLRGRRASETIIGASETARRARRASERVI